MMRYKENLCWYWAEGAIYLFTKDFEGVVVNINTKGILKLNETDEYVILQVQAGEEWDDFVTLLFT